MIFLQFVLIHLLVYSLLMCLVIEIMHPVQQLWPEEVPENYSSSKFFGGVAILLSYDD